MPQVGQRTSRVTSHLQWGFPGQREQLCFWPVRTQRHGGSHRATSSAGWPTWSGKVKVLDRLGDAILKSWRMEDDFKSSCHDSTFGGCWLSHNPPPNNQWRTMWSFEGYCLLCVWPGSNAWPGISKCRPPGAVPHGEAAAYHFWKQRAVSKAADSANTLKEEARAKLRPLGWL